jgi:hypothetical protein
MLCLFGHKWNGCKCDRCGKTRDENHTWNYCKGKCFICGKRCEVKHAWKGCKCTLCGELRNAEHSWKGGVCTLCGKEMTPVEAAEISDTSELIEIAKNASDYRTCLKAMEKLSEQNDFIEIAKNGKNYSAREKAMEKIKEQNVLMEIIETDKCEDTRSAAVKKLTRQTSLVKIANSDNKINVRLIAMNRIKDISKIKNLKNFIVEDMGKLYASFTRNAELLHRRIDNQHLLRELALHSPDKKTRSLAKANITDKAVLKEIEAMAFTSATEKIKGEDEIIRAKFLLSIADPSILLDFANTDSSANVRVVAVRKLTDLAILEEIALTDEDAKVRETAAAKITDKTVLAKIKRNEKKLTKAAQGEKTK